MLFVFSGFWGAREVLWVLCDALVVMSGAEDARCRVARQPGPRTCGAGAGGCATLFVHVLRGCGERFGGVKGVVVALCCVVLCWLKCHVKWLA